MGVLEFSYLSRLYLSKNKTVTNKGNGLEALVRYFRFIRVNELFERKTLP